MIMFRPFLRIVRIGHSHAELLRNHALVWRSVFIGRFDYILDIRMCFTRVNDRRPACHDGGTDIAIAWTGRSAGPALFCPGVECTLDLHLLDHSGSSSHVS